jgi:hypothetical protein
VPFKPLHFKKLSFLRAFFEFGIVFILCHFGSIENTVLIHDIGKEKR